MRSPRPSAASAGPNSPRWSWSEETITSTPSATKLARRAAFGIAESSLACGVHVQIGARDALQLDHARRAEGLDADLGARARDLDLGAGSSPYSRPRVAISR